MCIIALAPSNACGYSAAVGLSLHSEELLQWKSIHLSKRKLFLLCLVSTNKNAIRKEKLTKLPIVHKYRHVEAWTIRLKVFDVGCGYNDISLA